MQFRIARYSAAIGLVGAVVGAAGGVVGGYLIAGRQIDAVAQQSQREFEQTQRRDAFVRMLEAESRARDLERQLRRAIDVGADPAPLVEDQRQVLLQFESSNALVMLSAGRAARARSAQLVDAHKDYLSDLFALLAAKDTSPTDRDVKRAAAEIRSRLFTREEGVDEAGESFLDVVRDSLDIDRS